MILQIKMLTSQNNHQTSSQQSQQSLYSLEPFSNQPSTFSFEESTLDEPKPYYRNFETPLQQWAYSYAHADLISDKTVNLQATLLNTKINATTRSQMLDWMVEVLSNLSRQFSEATFFRSALIMDLFLKSSRSCLTDSHLHLIGLTSMYIGSKYEDVQPIRINELSRDAAFGKFTNAQIREKEMLILQVIKYQTSLKTPLEVLDFFMFKIFKIEVCGNFQVLRDLTRNFIILTQTQVNFNDYDVRYVVLSCLYNAAIYMVKFSVAKKRIEFSDTKIADSAVFVDLKDIVSEFLNQEISKGIFPTELFCLVEFIRMFLKNFKKDLAICTQMCKFVDFDPKYLVKNE